jgi:hypothetical protein
MSPYARQLRDFLVSLKLTVVLLVLGMLLVFAATLDQVNLGIWAVQEKYFRSFVVYAHLGRVAVPVFPGGYLIGGLVLINLIAAHVYRFTFSLKKSGILLAHTGLILLLVGELLSGLWQKDYSMQLNEGETKNFAESFRDNELVLIDTTDSQYDDVVAIPENLLARKSPIQHPKLPFRVVPRTYYPNSLLQPRAADGPAAEATAGFGERIAAAPLPMTYREGERNLPTAFVELVASDHSLGVFLVSMHLVEPQEFVYEGHTWQIAMRTRRAYQPFSLTLLELRHDVYPGTEIPKNFSSRVRVKSADGRDDRDVLIYMNNPLRYAGLTFYQYQMNRDQHMSVLQVVRNPSWIIPYVSCVLMTLGLVVQFGLHLVGFVRKRYARKTVVAAAAPRPVANTATPTATVPARP